MQLCVDIGNTLVKTGLFEGFNLIESQVFNEEPVYVIKEIYEQHPEIEAIIISSVRKSLDIELIPIPETIHHILLDDETPLPILNRYESPKTLGRDRIALAVAAAAKFPKQNCLIIDAGTCLTMDIVNEMNEYLGGTISPGIKLRLKSLHDGTANLPLIDFDGLVPEIIGKDTQSCMKSGSVNGMLNEINGAISRFEKEFDSLNIILTGGDSKLFDNELKSGIFADPKMVLRGLNQILLYNIEKS